ncbi:MAG: hypothetical protein HQ534_04200 [Armatimonadetes bacterium]|nr:hypothetical protein [Armatimonadota bacterium]
MKKEFITTFIIILSIVFALKMLYSEEKMESQNYYIQALKESFDGNQVDLGFPEPPDDVYFFPIDVNVRGYAFLDTVLINQWQIPEDILLNMSDEGLMVTCLNLPYFHAKSNLPSSTLFPIKDKLQFAINNFNGLQELLKRENIHKKLKQLYITPEFRLGEHGLTPGQRSRHYKVRISYLAKLLAYKEILIRYSEEELLEIFDRTSARYWSPDEIITSGDGNCLAGRIMYLLNYKPFLDYMKKRSILDSHIFTIDFYKYLSSFEYMEIQDNLSEVVSKRRKK